MTVNELIETLKQYDPEMRVLVDGYEGGYNDPSIKTEPILFDYNEKDQWYYGAHEGSKFIEGSEGVQCIILSRSKTGI